MSDTIMIPIPAPPDGWVFDTIRGAKNGEQYFRDGRWIYNHSTETALTYPVAIPVPPKWTPPPAWGEIFGDGWLTVDGDTELKVWTDRPYKSKGEYWNNDTSDPLAILDWEMPKPEMRPPKDILWKEAIWKIEAPK